MELSIVWEKKQFIFFKWNWTLNLLVRLSINSIGKLTRAAFLQIHNFEKFDNVVWKNGKYIQSLFLYN